MFLKPIFDFGIDVVVCFRKAEKQCASDFYFGEVFDEIANLFCIDKLLFVINLEKHIISVFAEKIIFF